jgi:hypothetical protein
MRRLAIAYGACAACSFDPAPAPETPIDAPDVPPEAFVTPRDCLEAFERGVTTDGPLEIDPDGPDTGEPPFTAFCNMTAAGGGWTLVYAYTFTDYDAFTNPGNAITPRPTWPYNVGTGGPGVATSTTIPSSPTDPNALAYPRWTELGSEFLVTSTINHHIACKPIGINFGSIVVPKAGGLACTMVQPVGPLCPTIVPDKLFLDPRGPILAATMTYYYWDGSTNSNYPTHDPCGTNSPNQANGVADPRGAIYLRRTAE